MMTQREEPVRVYVHVTSPVVLDPAISEVLHTHRLSDGPYEAKKAQRGGYTGHAPPTYLRADSFFPILR